MTFGPALLFCPADRPDRYAKAASTADTVILDLEDAVAPPSKALARDCLTRSELDPSTTIVRLNGRMTAEFELDLAALETTAYRTVMLAKTEGPEDLSSLRDYSVIALCESPLGVHNAGAIATVVNVVGMMWGAEDLVAALGGTASRFPDGRYRDVARYARAQVLIAAGAAGKPAFDTVHLDIADLDGLRLESEDAAASGFAGTACIHPSQVETVRAAFRPDRAAVEWARRVTAFAATQGGVFRFEGRMIDEPVLRQARHLLGRNAI